jgi:hypothetical protein
VRAPKEIRDEEGYPTGAPPLPATQILSNPLEPTVFHEPWWLEIASEGRYEVVESISGGKTVGRLPYAVYTRFKIPFIEMPMLTHFLGPCLVEAEGSSNSQFLRKLSITRELIQKLPKVALTTIKMHYAIDETVAFQEQGFRTSVQFTHEIDPLPVDVLWGNLRNKTRNVIRRAEEQIRVVEMTDAAEYMAFYFQNLRARGARSFLRGPVCERLLDTTLKKKRGRILAAYDDRNKLLAANFYVWDARSYYYLLTTRATESGNGTINLLVWEAMKDASERGLIFDSDGLNSNGSILFFAGLGGTMKPRYIVAKSNIQGRMLELMREAVWGKNYFVRG